MLSKLCLAVLPILLWNTSASAANALFVASTVPVGAADQVLVSRLQGQGHQVTLVDDNAVSASDANGQDLVIISSTVSSGQVNTIFTTTAVPLITWEAFLFDDLGMTGSTFTVDLGFTSSDSVEVSGTHSLSAFQTGVTPVVLNPTNLHWGVPSAAAKVSANVPGAPTQATIFGYEPGDSMVAGNAPARRVGFFLGDSVPLSWSAEATELFDAAVSWALSPTTNQAPVSKANAPVTTVSAGVAAQLAGQYIDDALTAPVTATWSLASGPSGGTANFSNVNDLASTVTFSSSGVYTLELTIDDSQLSATDTVVFNVQSSGGGGSQALFVGQVPLNVADQQLVTRLQTAGHTVTVVDDNAVTAADATGKNLVLVSSSIGSGAVNTQLTNVAVPVIVWEAFLFHDMDMTGPLTNVDFGFQPGLQTISMTGTHPLTAGLSGSPQVSGINQWLRWGAPSAGAVVSATLPGNTSRAAIFSYESGALMDSITAPARRVGFFFGDATARFATAEGLALFDAAVAWAAIPTSNQPPTVNAGPDSTATAAVPTTLQGSFTDDGVSQPVTVTWSVVTEPNPGDASIVNTSSLTSSVTFAGLGAYTLQLEVDDSEFSVTDTVVFTVQSPSNQPPVADAGADSVASVGVATSLAGSVSDDGVSLPLTTTWSVVTEPSAGAANIASPGSLTSSVTFASVGSYTLRLTADDSEFTSTDDVQYTVSAGGFQTLYVGAVPLNTADQQLVTRLQTAGHTVTVVDDNAVSAADATGKSLVLVSSSVGSSAVNTQLTNVSVPIIVWEAFLFHDMDMTGPSTNIDFGFQTGLRTINVTGTHPLTAGLSGSRQVSSVNQWLRWGAPSAGAVVSATLPGNANRAAIFSYETGSLMNSISAPARRVGFFFGDATARFATPDGLALFDAAVAWASVPAGNQPPTSLAGNNRTVQVAATTQLQGSFMDDGVTSPVTATWSVVQEPVGGSALITDVTNFTSPVQFTLPGVYILALEVDDTEFTDTSNVTYTVVNNPGQSQALFVSASNPVSALDTRMLFQLETILDLSVVVKSDMEVTANDAVGMDLIVVSESVISGNVGNIFKQTAVPVLLLEAFLLDDLGMVATTPGVETTDQTQFDVTGTGPLALGLSGAVTVSSSPVVTTFGIPLASADVAATSLSNSARGRLFSYETGAALTDINAPARRVFMALSQSATGLWTADAQDFFDASVRWLLGETIIDKVRIMPLGDSITRGTNNAWSYRRDLAGLAAVDQCRVDFVGTQNGADTPLPTTIGDFDRDHEGHGGFRTDQIDGAINGYLAGNVPDIVLLHLGTNDIGQSTSLPAAKESMRSIITKIRAENPNVVIYLAQIINRAPSFDAAVQSYNVLMEQLALEEDTSQSPVFLVDQNTGYSNSVHNQSDQLHPNDLGDALMASRWYTPLQTEISSVCNGN